MGRNRKPTPTKATIVKIASELFLENGFLGTTAAEISKKAGISPGNLTFYFPTKEHILAVLVERMLAFQRQELARERAAGKSALLSYCLELTALAAISEEIPTMYELLAAAYSHPLTLDLIRKSGAEKLREVFFDGKADGDGEEIAELEAIVSGIEYATLMHTEHSASLPHRIEGALEAILLLFGVPEDTRREKIAEVLSTDYRAAGRRVYADFRRYVTEGNRHALDEVLRTTEHRA